MVKRIPTRLETHGRAELAPQQLLLQRLEQVLRVVLLHLTREGQATLNRIVRFSFAQLRDEAPELIRSLRRLLTRPRHS